MTEVDRKFDGARVGDRAAFASWMEMIHRPVRESLRRFARAVDAEVVMQETFLRMWLLAQDEERTLEGENASLRFAYRVARNVALEEIRRLRLDRLVSLEELDHPPEHTVEMDPPGDPGLRRAIRDCVKRLPNPPGRRCSPGSARDTNSPTVDSPTRWA